MATDMKSGRKCSGLKTPDITKVKVTIKLIKLEKRKNLCACLLGLGVHLADMYHFLIVIISVCVVVSAELWQKDLSSDMSIGESSSGYRKVQLRCAADYMQVDVQTEEDFDGVIYTRGSYHNRQSPCFLDPRAGREFSLKIPLNKCHTKKQDDEVYSNVVVIQQDDELIMPGDAAFTLECDFTRPRDFTVNANLETGKHTASSRISLTDADPAAQEQPRHKRSTAYSESDTVVFTPEDVRSRHKRHS